MNFHPEADAKKETWITPPDMIYSFKNIGKVAITGVETEFSQRINKYFSWKLGYTYLHAINQSDPTMPRQLLNKPQHKIDIGLTYENKPRGLQVSLWGDYYFNMLDSNTIANNGNYVHNDLGDGSTVYKFAINGLQTYEKKTFGLWNLLIQKKLDLESLFYLGADNLLNHRDDNQAMPERTYKVGVNLKFDDIGEMFTSGDTIGGFTTLSADKPFITSPFTDRKEGVYLFGDYRIRHNVYEGKVKPEEARVTTKAAIGTAYKNYLEKGESGVTQRVRVGVSGYWFGKEYDGVRVVWTNDKSQIRIGYGNFNHSTGVVDSAYSRAEKGVFMRTPTKQEWLGYDASVVNDESYILPYRKVEGFESLYDKLTKVNSLTEEKKIVDEYFRVISKDDPEAYKKISKAASYKSNSHIWRIVTATDADGNVKKFITTDLFDTYVGSNDAFDQDALRTAGEKSWDTVMTRNGENPETWNRYVSDSGLLNDKMYTLTSEFYGYGTYTGTETLVDLGTQWNGKRYAGFELDKLVPGEFTPMTKEEAKMNAISSLYDKRHALELVRKKKADGNEVVGYRKAHISPVSEQIIRLASGNSLWKPEDNSELPLHLLEREGVIFPQEGIVLKADNIPAIDDAFYLQLRHEFTPTFGVSAWYLRSVANHEVSRLANVIGIGMRWKIGNYAVISTDYGVNHTKFGAYMNGQTQYRHQSGSSDFEILGGKMGDMPTFYLIRLDIGHSDTNIAGSWNAFIDYKSFSHGSFFGGNGTESLPDRYLDGVRSMTLGFGYVPTKNLLLEGFYTFGAEGVGQRDTLYGNEHFRLGDYTRVQLTYSF